MKNIYILNEFSVWMVYVDLSAEFAFMYACVHSIIMYMKSKFN